MGRAASDSALDATRDATRPRQLSRTRFRFDARDAAGDAPWGPRGRSRPSRRSPTWSDARRGGRRAKRGSVPCAGGSCDGETRARGSARGTFSSPRADFCRVSRHAEIPDQTQGETLNRKHRFADHENVLSDEAEPMEPQNGAAARRGVRRTRPSRHLPGARSRVAARRVALSRAPTRESSLTDDDAAQSRLRRLRDDGGSARGRVRRLRRRRVLGHVLRRPQPAAPARRTA